MSLDFLSSDEPTEAAEPMYIPTEGFATSGFIGFWTAEVLHTFGRYDLDIEMMNRQLRDDGEKLAPEPDFSRKFRSGWCKFWWRGVAEAREALRIVKKCEGIGKREPPFVSTVWCFYAKTESILNLSAAAQEAFGDEISYEATITKLTDARSRHEFHFISLPSAVAAVADVLGYENPGFDLTELTEADIVYTEDFQIQMIGVEAQDDGDDYKYVNAKGGYANSVLPQRRDALWAALGEENAKAFRPRGSGTKLDISSKKLDKIIRNTVESLWPNPIWAWLMPVPDPRVIKGIRYAVPALVKIYQSQEEAQVAAQELMGGEEVTAAGGPRLPTLWEGQESNWKSHVAKVKKALGGNPPTPPNVIQAITEVMGSLAKAGIGEGAGVEVQDYVNWM